MRCRQVGFALIFALTLVFHSLRLVFVPLDQEWVCLRYLDTECLRVPKEFAGFYPLAVE